MTETSLRDPIVKIVVDLPEVSSSCDQEALTRSDLARFYPPAYLGSTRELITDAYRLPAPRRLVAQTDG